MGLLTMLCALKEKSGFSAEYANMECERPLQNMKDGARVLWNNDLMVPVVVIFVALLIVRLVLLRFVLFFDLFASILDS